MSRRQLLHVAALIAMSVAVRALLFYNVGIWGDAGFYTYDAMLINSGLTPFLDFIGRSPLFNYAFAWVAAVVGNDMVTLRAFVVLWWILAGVPVYLLARRIADHRTGLVALAIFELSPFMLVYGYWENTQSIAAFLAVSATVAVLYREDWLGYAAAGLLLGLAFLSRRSVVTICAAIALWTIYTAYRRRAWRPLVAKGAAASVAFMVPPLLAYVAMAGVDVALAGKFFETHFLRLFDSGGRGGFPLITERPPPPVPSGSMTNVPLLASVCPQCGYWTVRTFVKTTVADSIAIAPLLLYVRDAADRWVDDILYPWASGLFVAIAAYGSYVAIQAQYYWRVGVLWMLIAVGWLAFQVDAPRRSQLYDRRLLLPIACLGLLAAGYLFRNRVLHTYYFADFMPWLAVVAAVCYVFLWDGLDE